jgi:ABC-type cobalamin transport system permease subunit
VSLAHLLKLAAIVLALVVASLAARRSRTTAQGIVNGTVCGLVSGYAMLQAVRFLSYVVPFGQIEFWLASQINRVTG